MDALDRLYWRLVEQLRAEGVAADGALTVARLYQSLIPYRGVRADLGLLELAQYEHALLRLLSGERDYLTLDPAEARDELRRELASPNPILGVYRDYADAAVTLNGSLGSSAPSESVIPADADIQDLARTTLDGAALRAPDYSRLRGNDEARSFRFVPSSSPLPSPLPTPTPFSSPLPLPFLGPDPVSVAVPAVIVPTAPVAKAIACVDCQQALPRGRQARFCPFCGTGQPHRCGRCGEVFEAGWRFCIDCGEPRDAEVAPRA